LFGHSQPQRPERKDQAFQDWAILLWRWLDKMMMDGSGNEVRENGIPHWSIEAFQL
jgi:hypothetical protein